MFVCNDNCLQHPSIALFLQQIKTFKFPAVNVVETLKQHIQHRISMGGAAPMSPYGYKLVSHQTD